MPIGDVRLATMAKAPNEQSQWSSLESHGAGGGFSHNPRNMGDCRSLFGRCPFSFEPVAAMPHQNHAPFDTMPVLGVSQLRNLGIEVPVHTTSQGHRDFLFVAPVASPANRFSSSSIKMEKGPSRSP